MERKTYCDNLRLIATFAVVVLHVAASNWYSTDVNGLEWQSFNFYDSVVRWGVPIFVMISGSLFLSREISIRKIYSKYILRMVIAFLTWSIFYALMTPEYFENGMLYGIKTHIDAMVSGHYHMWFVLMIIGIYMCIPFYNSHVSTMNMSMVMGYSFYFVLGYYLDNFELRKKYRILIYFLGVLGFAFTVLVDLNLAIKTQQPCDNYYGNFQVNVMLEAICIHTLFKYHKFKNEKLNSFVFIISGYTFGAYLIHAFFIEKLSLHFNFNTLSFNSVVSVPIVSAVVFICALLVSTVLNHIPIIKKYCV